jgi:hypothetical protein
VVGCGTQEEGPGSRGWGGAAIVGIMEEGDCGVAARHRVRPKKCAAALRATLFCHTDGEGYGSLIESSKSIGVAKQALDFAWGTAKI